MVSRNVLYLLNSFAGYDAATPYSDRAKSFTPGLGKGGGRVMQGNGAKTFRFLRATAWQTWPHKFLWRSQAWPGIRAPAHPATSFMTRSTSDVAVCCPEIRKGRRYAAAAR